MVNLYCRDTIGDMIRRASSRFGNKLAIAFRDKNLSFGELEQECCRFAHLMQQYGIGKGDRVAIIAYNSHYYPISFVGLSKIGAVQIPINYMLNGDEMAYIINTQNQRW